MRTLMLALAVTAAATLAGCGGGAADVPPAPGASPEDAGGDPARGRALLAQYQCGACHSIPRVAAARGMLGPPLDGFGRRSYIAGEVPNRPDALRRWIADPASLVPDTPMPDLGVSEVDARDMAAYLGTLR